MKMSRITRVLALGFFLLTGAAFSVSAVHAAEEGGHASKSEGGGKEEGEGKAKGAEMGPFVRLQPMVLPLVTENGAEQIITFLIVIQVKDSDAIRNIQEQMPRVQDAIFRVLYSGLSDGSLRRGNSVNLTRIKSRIINALGRVIDKNGVADILIQAVGQRAL